MLTKHGIEMVNCKRKTKLLESKIALTWMFSGKYLKCKLKLRTSSRSAFKEDFQSLLESKNIQ